MYSKFLIQSTPELKKISCCKGAVCKNRLKDADEAVIKSIAECCHNILKGNVVAANKKIGKLNKYKKQIRRMANHKVSLKSIRRLVAQTGGFVGPLLAVLAPVLSSILTSFTR